MEIWQSLEDTCYDPFISWIEKDEMGIKLEWFETLDKSGKNELFRIGNTFCTRVLENHHHEKEEDKDKVFSFLIQFIYEITIKQDITYTSEEDDYLIWITTLHDSLLALHEIPKMEKIQNTIALICEYSWTSKKEYAQNLIIQLIPYLVVKALGGTKSGGASTAMKRLYGIRHALELLDFEDESIGLLKQLLLRTFIEPLCIRHVEGGKFLAYLCTINMIFLHDIHTTMRNQISECTRKSVAIKYGQIYYKAWTGMGKEDEEMHEKKRLILEEFIQDFIFSAIHAKSTSLFETLRAILNVFHGHKKQAGMDDMLCTLYEPILWRALKAPNCTVRLQAACLFFDVFPLRQSKTSAEATDAYLQLQFDVIQELLMDTNSNLRVVAIYGTSRILCTYWELLPTGTIIQLLNVLTQKLVYDATSGAVRAAVFDGLSLLVDNHLSHSILKPILPKLSKLIHDSQERVRLAFVKLLVRIKSVRSIHFYDVVLVDELLHTMVLDGESKKISSELACLFLRSYFPQGSSGSDQVSRCLAFVQKDHQAAAVFYKSVYHHVSVGAVCKLAVLLFRCLSNEVKKETNKENESEESFPENENENGSKMDIRQKTGILCIMVELLQSVEKQYQSERHKASHDLLTKELQIDSVKGLLKSFNDHCEGRTLSWRLLKHIRLIHSNNEDKLCKLLEMVVSHFCALQTKTDTDSLDGAVTQRELVSIVDCLVAWGQASTIGDRTLECLEQYSHTLGQELPEEQGKSALNPNVGLEALLHIFIKHPDRIISELIMHGNLMEELTSVMRCILESSCTGVASPLITTVHRVYFVIMIHLRHVYSTEMSSQFEFEFEFPYTLCLSLLENLVSSPMMFNQTNKRKATTSAITPTCCLFLSTAEYMMENILFEQWKEVEYLKQPSLLQWSITLSQVIHKSRHLNSSSLNDHSLLFEEHTVRLLCRLLCQMTLYFNVYDENVIMDELLLCLSKTTSMNVVKSIDTCFSTCSFKGTKVVSLLKDYCTNTNLVWPTLNGTVTHLMNSINESVECIVHTLPVHIRLLVLRLCTKYLKNVNFIEEWIMSMECTTSTLSTTDRLVTKQLLTNQLILLLTIWIAIKDGKSLLTTSVRNMVTTCQEVMECPELEMVEPLL